METRSINQIWKSQDVISEINLSKVMTLRSTADELTLLRNQYMKRQLSTAPLVIIYFGYTAVKAIMHYMDSTENWTLLGSAAIMIIFMLLSIGRVYLLYRWRQAEIFEDTWAYLSLSRKILLGHMNLAKRGYLYFLPMIALSLITVFFRVQFILFVVILACFAIAYLIGYLMQPAFNNKLFAKYKPILDGIDAALRNINDPA